MKRNIIEIDQDKCNGCGICVTACHEGAIQMVDGKAKLMTESYCDGLGDCLPECPTGAITMEYREAPSYDEEAVKKNMKKNSEKKKKDSTETLPCGCPSVNSTEFDREESNTQTQQTQLPAADTISELRQWPVQIKLAPVNAPYFENAKLLIAADCTAFANSNVHKNYIKGRITLIGCPKLDMEDYSIKLVQCIINTHPFSRHLFWLCRAIQFRRSYCYDCNWRASLAEKIYS